MEMAKTQHRGNVDQQERRQRPLATTNPSPHQAAEPHGLRGQISTNKLTEPGQDNSNQKEDGRLVLILAGAVFYRTVTLKKTRV